MRKKDPLSASTRSTLSQVAERAGVSPSTVSRILNGTAQVSEAKKASVLKAIEDLNFLPDPAARSLAGGRAMSIGVLTQFIDSLKQRDPQLEERQRQGRSLLWDKNVDRDAQQGFDDARVSQQPYVYHTKG